MYFQFLNNIIHIFTHFFIHINFKKIQIILLILLDQTGLNFWKRDSVLEINIYNQQIFFSLGRVPKFFFSFFFLFGQWEPPDFNIGNEGLESREVPLPRKFHGANFQTDRLFQFSKSE